VGDAHNAPGRSLYVRLIGPTSGDRARGKWTDAATFEHGDLLDLIATAFGSGAPATRWIKRGGLSAWKIRFAAPSPSPLSPTDALRGGATKTGSSSLTEF
jgi:hypothetical protein